MRNQRGRAAVCLTAFLILVAISRFAVLDADPPAWLQGFVSDEGWWADAARGKTLFGDYFADDFGTAILMTPGYTWLLEGVFRLFGVGQIQTRSLAAMASVLLAVIAAIALWRAAGPKGAWTAAALVGFSPFFWAYGRVGLIESSQALLALVSVGLWVYFRGSVWGAAGTGLAMAAATCMKPNVVVFNAFPAAVAVLAIMWSERQRRLAGMAPEQAKSSWGRIFIGAASYAAGVGAVYLPIAFHYGDRFWTMLLSEAGLDAGHIATHSTWTNRLQIPGQIMMSHENGEWPRVWRLARWSPAIMAGLWIYSLELMLRLRWQGARRLAASFSSLETAALTATILCGGILLPTLWDRRFMLYLPFAAILVALSVSRQWMPDKGAGEQARRPGLAAGFIWWALLLMPAMVVAKPFVSLWIMKLSQGISIGDAPGLGYASCGTLFSMAWFMLLACLIPWRRGAVSASKWLTGAGRRPTVFGLLATEAILVAILLFRAERTLSEGQAELAEYIEEGETVLGHISATICMPLNVRTVRRSLPTDPTPPPNLDVWDRLKPRYILEMTRRNFHPDTRLYKDLVEEKGYESIHRIEVGPYEKGVSRYEFELFERPGDSSAL